MPERGHLQRLLPLIAGLAERGRNVHVMTAGGYARDVEQAGGRFFDLFARYPIEAADATSIPVPSRYVSFAGTYAEAVTLEVGRLMPGLIVYDTFAVVAPLIGRRLGVPYVNMCAGHALRRSRMMAMLAEDPRVATSAACWKAVERLREVHAMAEASPFSYVDGVSPFLNVYCEPEPFLREEDRAELEPLVFQGSLAPNSRETRVDAPMRDAGKRPRVYVSFGTVVWRYYAPEAVAALAVLTRTLGEIGAEVVVSLGNHDLDPAMRTTLARSNLRVESYVDQWAVLADADLFVTHHGLNSTHEAIFHRVPMISYPFFWDQPALARRCQDLGLAVPLGGSPRAPIAEKAVLAAVERVTTERSAFVSRLSEARAWELATIAGRGAVIDRILALEGTPA